MLEINLENLNKAHDLEKINQVYEKHGALRGIDYFKACLTENNIGWQRTVFAYSEDHRLLGTAHLLFESKYPYFQEENIPEINDLIVFPPYRRQGVAAVILDELETYAAGRHDFIGLGVGLYKDYGQAQRLYAKRGYLPDGRGLSYANRLIEPGTHVRVDDELLIYLTKRLGDED